MQESRPVVHVILILALLDCKEKKRIKKKIKDALSRGEEAIEVERNAYRYLEKKKKKEKLRSLSKNQGREKSSFEENCRRPTSEGFYRPVIPATISRMNYARRTCLVP